jgi:hypothetical protein
MIHEVWARCLCAGQGAGAGGCFLWLVALNPRFPSLPLFFYLPNKFPKSSFRTWLPHYYSSSLVFLLFCFVALLQAVRRFVLLSPVISCRGPASLRRLHASSLRANTRRSTAIKWIIARCSPATRQANIVHSFFLFGSLLVFEKGEFSESNAASIMDSGKP